jgi:hypothetical protein
MRAFKEETDRIESTRSREYTKPYIHPVEYVNLQLLSGADSFNKRIDGTSDIEPENISDIYEPFLVHCADIYQYNTATLILPFIKFQQYYPFVFDCRYVNRDQTLEFYYKLKDKFEFRLKEIENDFYVYDLLKSFFSTNTHWNQFLFTIYYGYKTFSIEAEMEDDDLKLKVDLLKILPYDQTLGFNHRLMFRYNYKMMSGIIDYLLDRLTEFQDYYNGKEFPYPIYRLYYVVPTSEKMTPGMQEHILQNPNRKFAIVDESYSRQFILTVFMWRISMIDPLGNDNWAPFIDKLDRINTLDIYSAILYLKLLYDVPILENAVPRYLSIVTILTIILLIKYNV